MCARVCTLVRFIVTVGLTYNPLCTVCQMYISVLVAHACMVSRACVLHAATVLIHCHSSYPHASCCINVRLLQRVRRVGACIHHILLKKQLVPCVVHHALLQRLSSLKRLTAVLSLTIGSAIVFTTAIICP